LRPPVGRSAVCPFGLIEPLEYVVSVLDLHGSRAAPPGNLHAVAVELHEMAKATKGLNEIIRSARLSPLETAGRASSMLVAVHRELLRRR
jgi:hypothetical protein